jgi:two-component system, OmpR family, response regulator
LTADREEPVPRRVLIVEDEENIVESLTFLLQREGLVVASVADGTAALREIGAAPPDLLILDVMLPGADGFEILRTIRADPRTADLPVLMLTARMQQKDRRLAEKIGVNAFVTKPFANAEVVGAVLGLMR